MTSRTLSLNLFKGECIRKIWLYALTFVMLMSLLPGNLLMQIDRFIMWSMKPSQIAGNVRGMLMTGTIGTIALAEGFIFGLICFGYLFSKAQVDMYHSLPIKRQNLFAVHYLAGLLPYILVELIAVLSELAIISIKGLTGYGLGAVVISGYICSIFLFALSFSITVIGMALTGNLIIGALISGGLIAGEAIIEQLLRWYRSSCFQTYTYLSEDGFSWLRFVFSPMMMPELLGTQISDEPGRFIVLIVVTVAITVASLLLYIIRPSETVGKAVAYNILQPVIRIPVVIVAALSGGIYLVFISGDFMTATWYWLIFILVGILTHVVLEVILQLDFKKALKHWPQLIISLAVAAVIACFYLYDIGGYDRYLPVDDKTVYSGIAFSNLDNEVSNFEIVDGDYSYMDRMRYILDNMQATDSGAIKQLNKIGVANVDPERSVFKRLEKQRAMDNSGVYDEEDSRRFYYVIRYKLNNGRSVYRQYNARFEEGYAPVEAVFNSPEYKDASDQIGEIMQENALAKINFMGMTYDTDFVLSGDDINTFLEIYDKELRAMTLEQMTKEYPIYQLGSELKRNDMYMDMLDGYYLYPSFTDSIAYLKGKGMSIDVNEKTFDIRRIEHIEIRDYSRTDYNSNDEGMHYEPAELVYEPETDMDIIEAIGNVAIPDRFAYVNSILKPYEERLDVNLFYQTEKGFVNNNYVMIPKGKLPQRVRDDIEKAYAVAEPVPNEMFGEEVIAY